MAEAEEQEIDEKFEEICVSVEKMIFLFDIIYHLYTGTCISGYSMKNIFHASW